VLAVVLAALAIALAGPLRQLISQRSALSSARQGVTSDQATLKKLQAQEKLWADPTYVAGQARDRLHYVLPGQVPYITLSPTPSPQATAGGPGGSDQPWYAQLWSSVQGADATPTPTPAPAPSVAPQPAT
jgi:cell division protein FtsB